MSRQEAVSHYNEALKRGQKYYRAALNRGEHPFPPVLDDIIDERSICGRVKLGLINVPSELIVGVKSAGRVPAMAGNFMPLLSESSEFAAKWINLCEAHLSDEGIRDAIICYEYMGRFYVQEGNKRASVLKSYDAPSIPAIVTRLIPEYSEAHEVQVYYEFMRFYQLSGLYSVRFRHRGQYAKLQVLLGFEPDQVWTEEQRRSLSAGYVHFCKAFDKVNSEKLDILPSEALLAALELFSLDELKKQSAAELSKTLTALWPEIKIQIQNEPPQLSTEPDEAAPGFLAKYFGVGRMEHAKVAFIYAFDPILSVWTRAHDLGREYLQKRLGQRVSVSVYEAYDKEYYTAMKNAVDEGAELIFATTPQMIDACRRIAAEYPHVKLFNCALHRHHAGVRMYYSRVYESKFITGAIAGAMTESDSVGYVANYPIFGVPAGINAFALGLRMTNPRARVRLLWSCLPGDPLMEFISEGINVISNRDAANPINSHWALDYGTYKLVKDGSLQPLATPYWDWGPFYEKVVMTLLSGSFSANPSDKVINYWWGMDSGVIDVQLSDSLPSGVRTLAEILKAGLVKGSISPFRTRIVDQNGILRCDGEHELSTEEIMQMDWLCENVDGALPKFSQLSLQSRELVRHLGIIHEEKAEGGENQNEDTASI